MIASLLLTLSSCSSQQPLVAIEPTTGGVASSDSPATTDACAPPEQPAVEALPVEEPDAEPALEPLPPPVCPEVKPCPACPAAVANKKAILGEYERVTINPPGFKYLARIDTGATTTSIHATDIMRFERDGENWVSFKLHDPKTGKTVDMERELKRRVRIKQAESEDDRRLTVVMNLKIGTLAKQVEVTLSDRDNMEFPVLIGRNFLLDSAVVDVSFKRLVE